MADGYWSRQPPNLYTSSQPPKRPRPDYDFPPGASGMERLHYLPRDDDVAGPHALKDTTSIGASYDRYLQNTHKPSFGSREAGSFNGIGLARGVSGGMPDLAGGRHNITVRDLVTMDGPGSRAVGQEFAGKGRGMDLGVHLPMDPVFRLALPGRELPLPPDASDTIFVEGLPRDCTEREVAHIFRPFLGYKETRLVTKEHKYRDVDSKILCFVDFTDAACAVIAMKALQGYKMNERDPDSPVLKLKFSRYPAPMSGHVSRSKR